MSIFLGFAVLGLVIFVIATVARPPVKYLELRPGQTLEYAADENGFIRAVFRPAADDPSVGFFAAAKSRIGKVGPVDPVARWVATVFVTAVTLSLILIWFVWDALKKAESPPTPFQEFLGSRMVGSAAFGILFGILFGYWLRSVIFREKDKPASYTEIVAGALMAILLVLGLIGQDVLGTMLTRVTGLEIGGTKLTFAEPGGTARGPPALANNAQPGQTLNGQTPNKAPDQSYGLSALAGLSQFIDRDAHYAQLLAMHGKYQRSSGEVFDELKDAQRRVDDAVTPFANCLSAYVGVTGDDGRVGRLLEEVAAHLRGYVLDYHRSPTPVPPTWETTFFRQADSVLDEAPSEECAGLVTWLSRNREKNEPLKAAENGARERPYLSIAYASMLAYEHQYVAAIESLDRWIKKNEESTSDEQRVIQAGGNKITDEDRMKFEKDEIRTKVFKLRVRNLIATYVEEWLRGTVGIQTRAVLNYHIDNLRRLIEGINADFSDLVGDPIRKITLATSPMIENHFAHAPADDGACTVPALDISDSDDALSESRLRLTLIRTLMAAKLTWISVALDHPDYFESYARSAERYADELLRLDLSCLQKFDPKSTPIKRAQSLDAFARVQLANRIGTEALSAVLNRDKTRESLESALAAAVSGREVIAKLKSQGKEDTSQEHTFLGAITAQQTDETLDSLKRTERQLRSAVGDH